MRYEVLSLLDTRSSIHDIRFLIQICAPHSMLNSPRYTLYAKRSGIISSVSR